jgi:uncharacterized protein (DUF2252 family)
LNSLPDAAGGSFLWSGWNQSRRFFQWEKSSGPLTPEERTGLVQLFEQEPIRAMITGLQGRESSDAVTMVDAAYWIKGCSSLGRLRYALMLRVGEGKGSALCLVDLKEGVTAAAPRAEGVAMPRDNSVRVVTGAKALSPNLGDRMIAARFLDTGIVLRELMPQDLKIEVDRLTREEATALAAYLAVVVGRAHGRQMDKATQDSWRSELAKGAHFGSRRTLLALVNRCRADFNP